jgi:hypothetical protein
MKGNVAAFALGVVLTTSAHAGLFDVSYFDADGPQWTGVVDTTADTLTLATWTEGAGGRSWWTPTDPSSLVFNALQAPLFPADLSQLVPFDVPESWDGTIGADWGFVSAAGKQDIAWNEGVFADNNSRLGWGIAQFNSGSFQASFIDENHFAFTPRSVSENTVSILDSADDFLSVSVRDGDNGNGNGSAAVPAPEVLALMGSGLALIFMRRRSRELPKA